MARAGTWWLDESSERIHGDRLTSALLRSLCGRRQPSVSELLSSCVHPVDRPRLRRALVRAWDDRATLELEVRLARPSGGVIWLAVRGGVCRHEPTRRRLFGIGFDVTDRKLNERDLILSARELGEEKRRRDAFLAGLGHELRNQLAVLHHVSHLLTAGAEEPRRLLQTFSFHLEQLRQVADDPHLTSALSTQPRRGRACDPSFHPGEERLPAELLLLVVDDLKDAADTLAQLLEAAGCTTYVAYSGREALEAAARHRPHVVLLDLGLPDIHGAEVARRIRRRRDPRPLLVALTGYGDDVSRQEALASGVDEVLLKPADLDRLLSLLQARACEGL